MEDESYNNLPNGIISESPESPSLKTSCNNNNNNSSSISSSNKEQDRFLPIANVGRIMKKVMPPNGKISKDAKETVQECVSEFISFITGEASDKCQKEKRKTINGDDIIWAISILGFDDFMDPLKCYLQKYRDIEGEKLNLPKQQRSEQRLHHHHKDQTNNINNNNNNNNNNFPLSSVYSSTNLISHQPPYVVPSGQPYTLPFSSPSSIKQDQIDSMGHW